MENLRRCTLCVMDESDPDISFDSKGICSYHKIVHDKLRNVEVQRSLDSLESIAKKIKQEGVNKEYDCLIGLSGGVDSSYITLLAGELGLKPLIVHFDNGWNSELAISNIEKLINKYNFDLHTLVVDWEEFKDIQLSLFKAGVPNIEMVTDHAISATLYKISKRFKIKYLLSGSNVATESILPQAWGHDSSDFKHIKAIHKKFGGSKIKTYPSLTVFKRIRYRLMSNIIKVNLLNYIDYSKEYAISRLEKEVGWEYYGGKHYESVFTKVFQAYILPKKFGFDKRKAHLSSLICNGEMTREEALLELEKPLYAEKELKSDIEYLIKKWGITIDQFNEILNSPPKSHNDYPTGDKLIQLALKFKRKLKL